MSNESAAAFEAATRVLLRQRLERNLPIYHRALQGIESSCSAVVVRHGEPVDAVMWRVLTRGERQMLFLLGETHDNLGRVGVTPDDDDDAACFAGLLALGLIEREHEGFTISAIGHELYGRHHQ